MTDEHEIIEVRMSKYPGAMDRYDVPPPLCIDCEEPMELIQETPDELIFYCERDDLGCRRKTEHIPSTD